MLFTGTIPTQIGQLDKVIDLDMSRNSLGGKLITTRNTLLTKHHTLDDSCLAL